MIQAGRRVAALSLLVVLSGCIPFPAPIPYPWTPQIQGLLLPESPELLNDPLLVAVGGSGCVEPSAIAEVGEDGSFSLPERKKKYWLLSMMETLGMISYELCLGRVEPAGDSTFFSRTHVGGFEDGDDLLCWDWAVASTRQVSCEAYPAPYRVHSPWIDGTRTGWWRIAPFADDVTAEPNRLAVQWFADERADRNSRPVVTTEVPLGEHEYWWVTFEEGEDGHTVMQVMTHTRISWWSGNVRLRFRVGAPGVVEEVE